MDDQIRQQQWKRLNKLKKIGWISTISIASASLLYYYYYNNTQNRRNITTSFTKPVVKVHKPPIDDPDYICQFKPHSILISDSNKNSKFFGLLKKWNIHDFKTNNNNIQDLCMVPTTKSSKSTIGYYIDSKGDLYNWDSSLPRVKKILSNYKLTSLKYSNNQIYSLSKDGNIYIFPTNNDKLFQSHLTKTKWFGIAPSYTYSIEKPSRDKIIQFDTGKDHLLYVDDKGKAFVVPTATNEVNEKEKSHMEQFGIMLDQSPNKTDQTPTLKPNKAQEIMLLNNELSLSDNKIIQRKIVKVACGDSHSMALTQNGDVLTFGNNKFGQLGHPILNFNHLNVPFPKQISSYRFKPYSLEDKPIDIFTMANTSFILLSNNILLSFGDGQLGQLGNNSYKNFQSDLTRVKFDGKIKSFITNSTSNHAFIIDDQDQIWTFGNNSNGQLLLGNHYVQSKPIRLTTLPKYVDPKKLVIDVSTANSAIGING